MAEVLRVGRSLIEIPPPKDCVSRTGDIRGHRYPDDE